MQKIKYKKTFKKKIFLNREKKTRKVTQSERKINKTNKNKWNIKQRLKKKKKTIEVNERKNHKKQ